MVIWETFEDLQKKKVKLSFNYLFDLYLYISL